MPREETTYTFKELQNLTKCKWTLDQWQMVDWLIRVLEWKAIVVGDRRSWDETYGLTYEKACSIDIKVFVLPMNAQQKAPTKEGTLSNQVSRITHPADVSRPLCLGIYCAYPPQFYKNGLIDGVATVLEMGIMHGSQSHGNPHRQIDTDIAAAQCSTCQ